MKTTGPASPHVQKLQEQLHQHGADELATGRAAYLGTALADGVASFRDRAMAERLVESAVKLAVENDLSPASNMELVGSAQAVLKDVRAMVQQQSFLTTLKETFNP